MIENTIALDIEIRNVLNSYFDFAYDGGDKYNFRCNVCGDSKRDVNKKRGYILKTNDPWMFYCHNCHASMPAYIWLKEYFPDNYKTYIKQIMMNRGDSSKNQKNLQQLSKKSFDPQKEKKDTVFFKPILKYPKAVEFCERRMIPKNVYSKWFFAVDGKYKNRIIIPFYNDKGRIYYYQGRMVGSSILKYLSRKGDHNSIYNYYLIDNSKPVVILEGPIDSIFVDNSVAVTGLKLNDDKLNHFTYKYFLLDNDKSGKKKCVKLLEKNQYVFNWTLFLKDHPHEGTIKDVNDFILQNKNEIKKLTWDVIEKYFTNKTSDKIYFI